MEIKPNHSDLGSKKVSSLLAQYAIPAIIAMTATSLYNITDSIFIGQGVGPLAISGLAITFPLMNLSAAFGTLVGIGGATLLSIRMGQKDYEAGSLILGNVFVYNIIIGVLFSVATLLFLDPILIFFKASPATLPYASDYMRIILLGNVISHMFYGLNAMLRSAGKPQMAMYLTIATVLLNVGLNAIFIFGLKMGIQGCAIATVLSQLIFLLFQLRFFSNPNFHVHFKLKSFKLKRRIGIDMFSIGMSPFLMNATACFIVLFINHGLVTYGGDLSVGAYGIVNRIAFVFIIIIIGLNQGMQPIAGYNFGAKQYDRVEQVLKISMKCATIIMVIGFLIMELIPNAIASCFTSDEHLIKISAEGLRIVFLTYPIIGFQIVVSNFFQSIGMPQKSIFLSLSRQLLFLLPCLYFLPKIWGVKGVWFSMPIADTISAIITVIVLYRFYKDFKRKQNN